MPELQDHQRNHLLGALPVLDRQRWQSQLEPIEMPLGQIVRERGNTLSYVYFPTTAIVSMLYVMESGASTGIAVAGNEGFVGLSVLLGGGSTTSRVVVHSAGEGYRMRSDALREELRQPPVMDLMLRYTQAMITQMAQTAACNRHHTLDQQLCRWLLQNLDRVSGNELVMTQELIANMLGVRREGVTEAALKLQEAGLMKYARGHIQVLDRAGMERRSCECYREVKKEYDRLLPQAHPH